MCRNWRGSARGSQLDGETATIDGHRASCAARPVMATDLRASVSLVIAGLAAEGETMVNRDLSPGPRFRAARGKTRQRCGAHRSERISGLEDYSIATIKDFWDAGGPSSN